MNKETAITIKELQDNIKTNDYYPIFKRDYLLRLEDEVAQLINDIYGSDSHHVAKPCPEEIGVDIGKIIRSILAIANLYNVDVEKSIIGNGVHCK